MTEIPDVTEDFNRRERAYQVKHLVPVLADDKQRWNVLKKIADQHGLKKAEVKNAHVWHFVHALSDAFVTERDRLMEENWTSRGRKEFVERWNWILTEHTNKIPLKCWEHPEANNDIIVAPTSTQVGWTDNALAKRGLSKDEAGCLTELRQVMSTECDVLIQTNHRIIIVECKWMTGADTKQYKRQVRLGHALKRLYERRHPTLHVLVQTGTTTKLPDPKPAVLTWDQVRNGTEARRHK